MGLRCDIENSFLRLRRYAEVEDDVIYEGIRKVIALKGASSDQMRELFTQVAKPFVAKIMQDAPGHDDGVILDYLADPESRSVDLQFMPTGRLTDEERSAMEPRLKAYHRVMSSLLLALDVHYAQEPDCHDLTIDEGEFHYNIVRLQRKHYEPKPRPEDIHYSPVYPHDDPRSPSHQKWRDWLNERDDKRGQKLEKTSQSWRERGEGAEAPDEEISR